MSEFTIHHGDCLDVLRTLEAGSVDAIVTDPPYGMAYQSAWRTDTERFDTIANDEAPFVWWLADAFRVLKIGGCLLCFCRWDSAEAFRLAIGWAGFDIGSQVIWDRVSHGMGDLTGSPAPMHDTIWFARKGAYKLPGKRPVSVVRSLRLSGDALVHPNEKPVELMRQLVESYTRTDDVVLDVFMGSGTTGVACMETGRNFIGIEIDAKYCDIARKRIKSAQDQGRLFSAP